MQTSSDKEQLVTAKEVKSMVRSSAGGLGGRLIGTYKFKCVHGCDPATITLTTPADYLIVNTITGSISFSTGSGYKDPTYGSGQSTRINSVIVCKGGDAYIPSSYGSDSDSDRESEYCVDAFCSNSISLSPDGLTITGTSNNSSAPAIGTIEAYSFT